MLSNGVILAHLEESGLLKVDKRLVAFSIFVLFSTLYPFF